MVVVKERGEQVNRRSLQRDLKGLLEKGLITTEGATTQLVYRLIA
jgi:hypothetical protein